MRAVHDGSPPRLCCSVARMDNPGSVLVSALSALHDLGQEQAFGNVYKPQLLFRLQHASGLSLLLSLGISYNQISCRKT